jgi:signal transduction histidine kinase
MTEATLSDPSINAAQRNTVEPSSPSVMSSGRPSLPPADIVALCLAVLSMALGSVVMFGWHARSAALVQIHPTFVAMVYNTALSFFLAGLAVLAIVFPRRRSAMLLGGLVALLGALNLVEYIAKADLGIDNLFVAHTIVVQTSNPGRMAPNTALCFLLSGAALLLFGSELPARPRTSIGSILGASVAALGLTAILGYSSGLELAYGWATFIPMAVNTAAGFIVLGAALLTLGWRPLDSEMRSGLSWYFVPVAIGLFTLVVALWQALEGRESQQVQIALKTRVARMKADFERTMKDQVEDLERMRHRWEVAGGTPRAAWEADAEQHIAMFADIQAIAWVDESSRVRWRVPSAGNEAEEGLDLGSEARRRQMLLAARDRREITVIGTMDLARGGKGFLVYAPLLVGQRPDGFIIELFMVGPLLQPVQEALTGEGFTLAVYDGEDEILGHAKTDGARINRFVAEETLELNGIQWHAHLSPSASLLNTMHSPLPKVALGGGMFLILLVLLATHLAHGSRRRANALRIEITQRKAAEDAISRYSRDLERSNRELDQFAYLASHDLKAPLRAIDQLATWIEGDLRDQLSPETADYLRTMRSRIDRMEKLLNDLLAYSRLGRTHNEFCDVDTGALIAEVFELLGSPESFQLRLGEDLPRFVTLRVPLEQVFRNLLNNAIKHHDRQAGEIRVSCRPSEIGYEFIVADDGPGIPQEHEERVFGLFQTLRSRDEVEGSGMGLAIVKKIVETYGGNIKLRRNEPRGAAFYFTWPNEATMRRNSNG